MRHLRYQQGFTAVELLITLFVAAAFLIAGYQLFNVVIKDGGQARAESRAANVAYDYLRRYSANATDPCTPLTPLTNSPLSIDGLSNATISIVITCPSSSTPKLSEVEATITFNSPQQTVRYSTFTPGALTPGSSDVLNGLIAWWPLNGNANTNVGSGNGTINGTTAVAGQNTQPNGALSFNGTSDYVNAQVTGISGDYIHTLSIWLYPRSLTSSVGRADPFTLGNVATNGSYSGLDLTTTFTQWYFYGSDVNTTSLLNLNQWSHVVMVYTGGGGTLQNRSIYINGTLMSLTGGNTNTLNLPTTGLIGIGYDRGRNTAFFNGNIDDVRLYNRALTIGEISTLYGNGAK